ncbi:hypothetical protein [Hyphococcus sp.]|uniref:hypothetical protein n=1 Tax=Hyphococcus sp. TaxID=2038636 RepID=UPI003CCBA3BD
MSDRQNELRDVDLLGRSFASAESRHSVASKLRKAGFDRWPDEKSGLRTALEGWGDADEYYVREARSLLESGTPLLAIRIHYDQNDNLRSAIGGYFPGLWSF